ncbi:MAG: hypothetical protein ACOCP4_05435 [Candidatus Woesearchaeota archaeon]
MKYVIGCKDHNGRFYRGPIILERYVELPNGQIVPGGFRWRLLSSINFIDFRRDGESDGIFLSFEESIDAAKSLGYTIFMSDNMFEIFGKIIQTYGDNVERVMAKSALGVEVI